jgi:hypothetical protein
LTDLISPFNQPAITLYHGFETAGLRAPFGEDHPSYILGLLKERNPSRPDGRWWTPQRPSASIDNLGLSDLHRGEDRDSSAITLKWNRLDRYAEGQLAGGSLVYVGRAAPQKGRSDLRIPPLQRRRNSISSTAITRTHASWSAGTRRNLATVSA